MQVEAYFTVVHTHNWIDRFAKYVLQLNVWDRVWECWIPAEHDSHDQGQAAVWQREADRLAIFAKDHPELMQLPWGEIARLWKDPPAVII